MPPHRTSEPSIYLIYNTDDGSVFYVLNRKRAQEICKATGFEFTQVVHESRK